MPFLMVPITSSNSIDKWVILGKKLIFRNFIRFFPTFLIGLTLGFLLTYLNDLLLFRILQQYQLFEMTPVSSFCSFANGHK